MLKPLPLLAAILAAIFWVVLAWRTPSATHHFAPLVIAGLHGFLAEPKPDEEAAATYRPYLTAVIGFAIAFSAFLVLLVADKLQGPGLYSSVSVEVELVLHAIVGAVVGTRPWTVLAGDVSGNPSD